MSTLDHRLDDAILSACGASRRKVAAVIVVALEKLNLPTSDANTTKVAQRIEALVQAGQLELYGALSKWRHSEVCRPANRCE